eukprot:COSAG01_NODE_1299_length_10836_cov_8.277452_4_plen_41_part_00
MSSAPAGDSLGISSRPYSASGASSCISVYSTAVVASRLLG